LSWIPEGKRFFRIGEVSRIIGVEPYVLRYWETEFSQIRPRRADSNQRTYQRKDLETIMEIKKLLYEEKMTIEGAKRRLKKKKGPAQLHSILVDVEHELKEILHILK